MSIELIKENSGIVRDWQYRTNFKQNAKGHWQGEFTVRADTQEELRLAIKHAFEEVETYLDKVNIQEVTE